MKRFILLLSFCALCLSATAQSLYLDIPEKGSYTSLYYYPSYQDGSIQFEDGTIYMGELNILLAQSTLCYLDEDHKPRVYDQDVQVKLVTIGRNYFMPLLGHYIQMLETDGNVIYGLEQYIELQTEKRYGAFGREETSPNTTIQKINLREIAPEMALKDGEKGIAEADTPYTIHQNVYLIKGKKAYAVSEKNFNKFFTKQRAEIASYLKENSVDFSNPAQTLALFKHLIATAR